MLYLILKIPRVINWYVILKDVQRILASLIAFGSLGTFYHNIGDTVTHIGCGGLVTLFHALGKLNMGLFVAILIFFALFTLFSTLSEALGNHQKAEVDLVLEQVADKSLAVADGCIAVTANQQLV